MGKGGRNQASHVDLSDALRPGPGEEGMVLDERQSILDSSVVGPFNHSRHLRISDRPQRRHRLHRGERQVITSHRLGSPPRIFRDLASQFPSVNRLPAMRCQEALPGHLGPHPRPISSRQRSAGRKASRRLDRREASCHFEAEGAEVAVNDLERRPKPGRILIVQQGEVGSFQLLLSPFGKRMQAAAEQRPHLLGGHRVTDGQAVDAVQAGADPHPGRLTPCGVVRGQPDVPFLGRIQSGDLPGQVVITGPCCELVHAHRHTHRKGVHGPARSGRPELLPAVHGVCSTRSSESSRGYVGRDCCGLRDITGF
jgi:hypothetical protein